MQIIENIQTWKEIRNALDKTDRIGFVPTMGNLHAGHLSLTQASRDENTCTLVSLFVNPTQFNNPEDFTHYPRTLEQDLDLLRTAQVDYCFIPQPETLYPDNYRYQISENLHSSDLEGACRPGHFTGVLTIVMKLLQIIRPHTAYFGEKDYQQYALIEGMTKAFFIDTTITLCPTVREPSGLAYSSRNNRLSPQQRQQAEQFATIFHQGHSCTQIEKDLTQASIQVEYIREKENRRYAAVKIGEVRLIDNYALIP